MISALLYLQYHSLKNRTLMRIKRLKQPKYLLGGLVGGLYFYFYFIRSFMGLPGRRQPLTLATENLALYEAVGALMLVVAILIAWLVPHERAALSFSEAEVAFLFPAPLSRRGLVHFKLLRSQTAILFTSLLLMLISNRWGGKLWFHAAGWWLLLSTLNLHFLGSSFARTLLLDRGISNWQRRLGILALLLVVAGLAAAWTWRSLPPLDRSQFVLSRPLPELFPPAKHYLEQVLTSGPLPYIIYPLRLVVRPYLATTAAGFFLALCPALLVLAAHYVWVIRSDVAFEEASLAAARKTAEKLAAVRAGNWRSAGQQLKPRRQPFALGTTGPPAVAVLWKNLISTGQAFTLRMWVSLAILAVVACVVMGQALGNSGALPVLGGIAALLLVWSLILGPQFLRQDLRQDFLLADVLKTYPLPGWQIALGEVLAPAVVLTAIQWVLLLVSMGLWSQTGQLGLDAARIIAIGLSAALIVPMLNLITLLIPNAAVLLFPAWFQTGREGPQGLEATGQRIIFLFGQLVVFLITMIPAAAAFTMVFLLARLAISPTLAIPVAAVVAAMVLSAEAALGLWLLGWLFDRLDLSNEPTA